MSETTNHSPEVTTVPTISGAPEGLQPAVLDSMVGRSRGKADIEKEWLLDEALTEHGFASSETDEATQVNYTRAKELYGRLMDMKSAEWIGLAEDSDRTERDRQIEALEIAYQTTESENEAGDSSEEGQQSEQIDRTTREYSEALVEADARMDAITKKYAELVGERSKRMFEGKTTSEQIDAAKEQLTDLIGATATEMYDTLEADGIAHEEIVAKIDAFVAEQTDKVVAEMEANRVRDYEKSSPLKKALLDEWARLGDTKMGKFKKALVFAVPSAVIGAAAMPVIGAIGAGAGIGAGAFMVARSIGRRIAGAKLDAAADATRIGARQSAEIRGDIAGKENASHQEILDLINERSEKYRKSNRNRMLGGTAIAMTVGLVSGTLAEAVEGGIGDLVHWSTGHVGESVRDHFVGSGSHDGAVVEHPGHDGHSGTGHGHGHGGPEGHHFDPSEIRGDARMVTPGEGWYQTFGELHISQDKWADVLKTAGPKLQEQGWAYRMPDGQWGISHQGRLTDSALKTIARAAARNGASVN